ncbi:hypothetical protein ARMGADRAFT_743240 [Armillaria gallica]|uniref:Uncharacterized protein n=1 Tax=Armillaria gallica TaxID=47427 RepID=A0A2H3DNP6_ARMGA|nr:hypothetical protein ARMGADRAFT_743240 [Armillaria gallica]
MSTGCATVSGVTTSARQERPRVETALCHRKPAAARRSLTTPALYVATLLAYLPIVSAEQVCHTTDHVQFWRQCMQTANIDSCQGGYRCRRRRRGSSRSRCVLLYSPLPQQETRRIRWL